MSASEAAKLPAGYYLTSIFRGNVRTWIVATEGKNDWIVCGQPDEQTAILRALAELDRRAGIAKREGAA